MNCGSRTPVTAGAKAWAFGADYSGLPDRGILSGGASITIRSKGIDQRLAWQVDRMSGYLTAFPRDFAGE
jgi:hypothetical protein